MATKHLTDLAVERFNKPKTGRTEISDSEPGLFLWITSKGLRNWVAIYRLPDASGKRTTKRKKLLGRFPSMDVATARVRTREVMALAAEGVDPELREAQEREVAERERAEALAGSFRAVAASYVVAMEAGQLVGGRNRPVAPRTAMGRKRLLERYVFPGLGDLALTEVTPFAVSRLLAKVEIAGGPADEVLAGVRLVYKFAASRGLFHGAPPTLGMTNRQAKKKRGRALADAEMKAIWRAAGEHGSFGRIVKMLMLTGQRRNELAGLRWGEIDWDRKLLIVPVDRVKNRAGAHEVPLSEPALEILREAQAACLALARPAEGEKALPPEGLVFPSEAAATADTPISGWSKLRPLLDRTVRAEMAGLSEAAWRAVRATGALRRETWALKADALAKIETVEFAPWRMHDLRHTFVSRCRDGDENAEGEIVWSAPLDVLQATVNHEITAGVTATYDHGDIQRRYRLRKRELMEWWARKLMVIVGEAEPVDNVVPLALTG